MANLTAIEVKRAKPAVGPDGKAKKRVLHDGGGLMLVVKPSGARSWLLRLQVDGKRRDIGLGTVDADGAGSKAFGDEDPLAAVPIMLRRSLTLAEAREKAAALRKLAKAGADPLAERDRERVKIPNFAQAVKEAHEELGKGWAPKHSAAFLSSLQTHIVPRLGNVRIDQVDEAMVRDALAPIWSEKPAMARKLRIRVGQVLKFAKSRKWRSDGFDPKQMDPGLARHGKKGHFAAMPYRNVPAFVAAQQALSPTSGRLALLFTILTAARSGEVRAAAWDQFDMDARTWTRPAAIMKTKVQHIVSLSDAAIAVLERAKPYSGRVGLVFPGAKPGTQLSDMTLTKVLRDAGEGCTVHGFRSSFRDWAAEQMPQVPVMVAEMALAHRVGNETERAYLRTDLRDRRRDLMDAWGSFLVLSCVTMRR
jgi:integrase